VVSALGLATRESVEDALLLPPTRLKEGSPVVDGEREEDTVPEPLPLKVLMFTLPVGSALGVRMELRLAFRLELRAPDKVTEGEGLTEGVGLPESVGMLLALEELLMVPT